MSANDATMSVKDADIIPKESAMTTKDAAMSVHVHKRFAKDAAMTRP